MQSSLCLTNPILPRFVFVAVASAAGSTLLGPKTKMFSK